MRSDPGPIRVGSHGRSSSQCLHTHEAEHEATETPLAGPAPWNPNSVLAPAARLPFQEALAILLPPLRVPFHAVAMEVPEGRDRVTDQVLSADEPAVTLTEPVKPPPQELPVE